ncbi:MAG: bifunctional riboflavin kinase/FAD synthetase [Lachnospiraceae bacterium]|nr:bifunctional riboflavin kinase/FAD synthetase [Lachnospiraceae bacterium]
MIIFENTLHFHTDRPTVVAIGKFDGIHKGHMEILKEMLSFKKQGLATAILTFTVPPQTLLHAPGSDGAIEHVLTTNREKRKIFSELGIDYYVEIPFDEAVMQICAEQFVKQILLERLNMRAIVCGNDCRFGYGGSGDTALLKRMGEEHSFTVRVVDKVFCNGVEISSSAIRTALLAGRIEEANAMLMRPYLFYGEVVEGLKIGRTLGMPTVNLIPEEEKLLPPKGVYYSRVLHMGQEYRAITNIGSKPTIHGDKPGIGLESYLYHFSEEIYGDFLFLSLYHFVRDEIAFDSIDALKAQMQQDIEQGRIWHRENL